MKMSVLGIIIEIMATTSLHGDVVSGNLLEAVRGPLTESLGAPCEVSAAVVPVFMVGKLKL